LLLDILPSGGSALQSSNPWIQEAFNRPVRQNLTDDIRILIPTFFDFLALKFQAFSDRGNGDFLEKDMEDIIAVINGYPNELPGQLPNSSLLRVQRFKSRVTRCIEMVDGAGETIKGPNSISISAKTSRHQPLTTIPNCSGSKGFAFKICKRRTELLAGEL
jgi:hypothetical protein